MNTQLFGVIPRASMMPRNAAVVTTERVEVENTTLSTIISD
jgi:hypothetical protein